MPGTLEPMRTFAWPAGALLLLAACSGGGGTTPGLVDGGGSSSSGSTSSTSSGATSSGAGGSICEWTSKCPAEEAPSEGERAKCRTDINGPCGQEYQAFGACFIPKETCTSSGKSDGTAAGNACANELQAWSTCRSKNSGSSGSSGSSGG